MKNLPMILIMLILLSSIVGANGDPEELSPCNEDYIKTCSNGTNIIYHKCIDGKYLKTAKTCKECTMNMNVVCCDGVTITVKQCINNKYVPTSQTCEDCECTLNELINCSDGSTIVNRHCMSGKYSDVTGAKCAKKDTTIQQLIIVLIMVFIYIINKNKQKLKIKFNNLKEKIGW